MEMLFYSLHCIDKIQMAKLKGMRVYVWEARHQKQLSLVQLAALSGISKTTINDIENEKLSPTLIQLEALAKALDMRMTDLFESKYK